jgi:hypothetical protein
MKIVAGILVGGVLLSSSVEAANVLAGPLYNPATAHTYFLLSSSDWTDAESTALGMAGHLVTINDAAENLWVLTNFSNYGGQPRALWTGLNDAAQEGVFIWSSGEPVSYTHWESGEPDDGIGFYPHENYVLLWPSPGPRSPGYWNDYIDTDGFTQFSMKLYGLVEITAPLNNWTNPFSAKWESPSWSLGKLPASDEVVSIVNDGYKAVNIDAGTVSGSPGSLTVNSLIVGAPTNGLSTLLLNSFGLGTQLKVLHSCSLQTNGTLLNLSSSFELDGANGGQLRVDGGTFVQEGGQSVVNGPISILNNGSMNTTNANLTLGTVTIGAAPASFGTFIQDGGSIAAQQLNIAGYGLTAPLQPWPEPSGYQLVSGVLYAINGTYCAARGPGFVQSGGTNYGDITVTEGYYDLRAGMAKGNVLTAAGSDGNSGLFSQEGGLLDMQYINVTGGTNWPPDIGPWFSGGTVHCGTLNIGGNGKVELRGSDVFVTNNFDLHGMYFNVAGHGPLIEHAVCELWSGSLHLPSMTLGQYAYFDLMGGSNEITGGLSILGGQYSLYGGVLETTYTGVGLATTFVHGEGQHFIHGVLSVTGTYALNNVNHAGGCAVVSDGLYLRGALNMTINFNGRYNDPAATFTNKGVLNLGGNIATELPLIELGQVQLATNTLIDLSPRYSATIRMGSSSGQTWTPGALLLITNWNSSDHVFAGNNASGLTASQLRQVEFVNPGGFTLGTYPAQILSTGEVVPGALPSLLASRTGSTLVLTWPGNYQLLSATNTAGPWTPVAGASSPWTASRSKPAEFFRLQGR